MVVCAAIFAIALVGSPRASAAEATKVTIAQAIPTVAFAPLYVAKANGYFELEGLEVDIQVMNSGPDADKALIGGSADFTAGAAVTFALMASRYSNVIAVQNMAWMLMNMVLHKDVVQRVGITNETALDAKIKALKGLTLGTPAPGSAADLYTRFLLRSNGLDPDKDVVLVQIGTASALTAALRSRRIDGFLLAPPAPNEAEAGGFASVIIKTTKGEVPAFREFIHEVVSTRKDYAERNPGTVEKVVRAITKANLFINRHPDKATELLTGSFPKISPRVLTSSMEDLKSSFPTDGRFIEAGWQAVITLLEKAGILKAPLDAKEGRIWTNRYVKDVPKGL